MSRERRAAMAGHQRIVRRDRDDDAGAVRIRLERASACSMTVELPSAAYCFGKDDGEPPAAARGRDDDEIAHGREAYADQRAAVCLCGGGFAGSAVRGRTGTTW